jgi:Glycosyltransferase family 9 (heptosyltransferase)
MSATTTLDLMAAGSAHALTGDWAAAEEGFRAAWRLEPGNAVARHSLATTLLALGRYREGFVLYSMRRDLPHFARTPALLCPEWQGEALHGKHILLFPEQGLGDEIQFARFAPHLAEMGAEVTLFCKPLLARLFESMGVRVIAAEGQVEFPDPDFWAFSVDVPARLGMEPRDLPSAAYLGADARASRGGRVGVMRRGNPFHANDTNRSMPDDIQLPFDAINLAPENTGARDMRDTAELIAGLDLVVSVDTAVAHLAGAMGKPTFVLLPATACDWRWMSGRDDSPWYPSMSLFRRTPRGTWTELVERVDRSVQRYLAGLAEGH